jgi:hypothetical protein
VLESHGIVGKGVQYFLFALRRFEVIEFNLARQTLGLDDSLKEFSEILKGTN